MNLRKEVSHRPLNGYGHGVRKPMEILVGDDQAAIIYEDRTVLAIDKPARWMLAPSHWQNTGRNLMLEVEGQVLMRAPWAQLRNIKYLRFIHRLDADTTGVLLGVKSEGAVLPMSKLFETRNVEKSYLAVVEGCPTEDRWTSSEPIGEVPGKPERMHVDRKNGKPSETDFVVVARDKKRALIAVYPRTGRTHQIRVHLQADRLPIQGDLWYRAEGAALPTGPLALRAVALQYLDPFMKRRVVIRAKTMDFLKQFGFASAEEKVEAMLPAIPGRRPPLPDVQQPKP